MLSFVQYEMKLSEATPFRRSILIRFESLELPQFPLRVSQFTFKSESESESESESLLLNLLRTEDLGKG